MTFEKILNDLTFNIMKPEQAYGQVNVKDKLKKINYYSHISDIRTEPLTDNQLQELNAIVGVLQILYNSPSGSPVADSDYDSLQEALVNMGIPRLTGSIEINDQRKVSHKYTQLRGTLGKTYYLTSGEPRVNKSRKYLDEWLTSATTRYQKVTGKSIDMNKVKICLQPKFDGVSSVMERDVKPRWITRGDTGTNRASDITHIMRIFNSVYADEELGTGIQFESMISEDALEKINSLMPRDRKYRNSRQVVTSIFGSNEPDFKADYIYPVPLRIIHPGDELPQLHPMLLQKFPTLICTFGDREIIRNFANTNRYVWFEGHKFRTDGVVMTIIDQEICKALGRENNINQYEVAYKFTEETAYSRVKDIEFYVSEFGFITPVLVINPVILKGNTITRISLSNKERFDELNFSYGDDVKVLYDIIPYATVDYQCKRIRNGRKIEFITECPRCHEPLDLGPTVTNPRCSNPRCPSRRIGRVLNYCNSLRIKNIGYQTLTTLWSVGLLNHGIYSLYKLRKHASEVQHLEGFGTLKIKKMIAEIEAKRQLYDYEFFGSIGILGINQKTFKQIFKQIKLDEFMNLIKVKNTGLMKAKLIRIKGIDDAKADCIIKWMSDPDELILLKKLMKEVHLVPSYSVSDAPRGKIVFTKCRPTPEVEKQLKEHGWEATSSWSNKAKILIVPDYNSTSTKVDKARDLGIEIMSMDDLLKSLQD